MYVSYHRHALLVWMCLWWSLFHALRSSHACEVATHKHMYNTNICSEPSLHACVTCLICCSLFTFCFLNEGIKTN